MTSTSTSLELVQGQTPDLGLGSANLSAVTAILNRILSDEHVLYIKLRNYHWNVVGPLFGPLHEAFQQQYTQLEAVIDEVAERIRTLGALTPGTMTEFLKYATLREAPNVYPSATAMVTALVSDHEALIRSLRRDLRVCDQDYDDMGTSDFLTGLMQQHEKMAWLLRSIIEERV